jgi:hypothetical protein
MLVAGHAVNHFRRLSASDLCSERDVNPGEVGHVLAERQLAVDVEAGQARTPRTA